jgi:hypothetical protein
MPDRLLPKRLLDALAPSDDHAELLRRHAILARALRRVGTMMRAEAFIYYTLSCRECEWARKIMRELWKTLDTPGPEEVAR